jgi:U3 small nucleolar RNA-associated protein 10
MFFVEVLEARPLPGSLDLISHLLETLNRVVQSVSPAQADVSYIEQLLMSTIESSASKIKVCRYLYLVACFFERDLGKDMPNLSPSAVRLDIVVELIRGKVVEL